MLKKHDFAEGDLIYFPCPPTEMIGYAKYSRDKYSRTGSIELWCPSTIYDIMAEFSSLSLSQDYKKNHIINT